jgi:hypothetical protein
MNGSLLQAHLVGDPLQVYLSLLLSFYGLNRGSETLQGERDDRVLDKEIKKGENP